jgi:hypothetical protein
MTRFQGQLGLLDHRLALYGRGPADGLRGQHLYRTFAQTLAASMEDSDVRDPWVARMLSLPANVVSTTLQEPLD